MDYKLGTDITKRLTTNILISDVVDTKTPTQFLHVIFDKLKLDRTDFLHLSEIHIMLQLAYGDDFIKAINMLGGPYTFDRLSHVNWELLFINRMAQNLAAQSSPSGTDTCVDSDGTYGKLLYYLNAY